MDMMVILKCDAGSKAATVICPKCKRISRRILSKPYIYGTNSFLAKHECPICKSIYTECRPAVYGEWKTQYESFLREPNEYESSVKRQFLNLFEQRNNKKAEEKKETGNKDTIAKVEKRVDLKTETKIVSEKTSAPNENVSETVQLQNNNSVLSSEFEDAGKEKDGEPAKTIPQKFVINEKLEKKIDHWKKELLDTGKRNRMINYRDTRRQTLRILEPSPVELFNQLAVSEKELEFQRPISKDSDFRTFAMLSLLETFNYSLPVTNGDIRAEGTIAERERTLKNLRAKTKLALEEQGTNILYLSFGFILWKEDNKESTQWVRSPLLMMPVQLGLKSLNAPYTLKKSDDDVEVNPTLKYLFGQEYGIELPDFKVKDKKSFENYLDSIEEIIDTRGWKLIREVSLGLLSFLKISMYHDLNNNRDRMINSPVIQAIAGNRFALGNLPERANNFNFDKTNPSEWHEVVDSDSSQEEAILLSKLGVSFVMQGPPGTGKSQTITNIIAEALGDGKKILFVSEKLAALQVVLKRLTDVRLDDFCLPLHNYKANKKEIIENIGANLRLNRDYVDSAIMSQLTELFHDREYLDEYAEDLHKKIEPFGESVYMVFGKLAKLRNASTVDFKLDNPTKITKEEYLSILYVVDAFEKALRNMDGKLSDNPWVGTTADSAGQTFNAEMLSKTEGLIENLSEYSSAVVDMNENYGSSIPCTWDGLSCSLIDMEKVLSLPLFPITWLDGDKRDQLRERALKEEKIDQAEQGHAKRLHEYVKKINDCWNVDQITFTAKELSEKFANESRWVGDDKPSSLAECNAVYIKDLESTRSVISELSRNYNEAKELLRLPQNDNIASILLASRVLQLVCDAPEMDASWFDIRRSTELFSSLEIIKQHQDIVNRKVSEILGEWSEDVLKLDTAGMLGRFKTEYTGIFHKFHGNYKDDIKQIKLLSKTVGLKVSEEEVISLLMHVDEVNSEKKWFIDNESKFRQLYGDNYTGADTDCEKIKTGINRAIEIAKQFPYASIPTEVIAAVKGITTSIELSAKSRRLIDLLKESIINDSVTVLQSAELITGATDESSISEKLFSEVTSRISEEQEMKGVIEKLDKANKENAISYAEMQNLIESMGLILQECNWFKDNIPDIASELSIKELTENDQAARVIESAALILKNHDAIAEADETEELTELFGNRYTGNFTDWQQIISDLNAVEEFVDGGIKDNLKGFIEKVCDNADLREEVYSKVQSLNGHISDTGDKFAYFDGLFPDSNMKTMHLADVTAKYQNCVAKFGELNKWLDYIETKNDCDKKGLTDFTEKISAADNTIADVKDAFEKGFYTQWLALAVNDVSAVQTFKKRSHEQKLEQFKKLDKKQFEYSISRIRDSIIKTFPDRNIITGAHSSVRKLEHEMEKKRKVMPLRTLFSEIPDLMQTLKPCFMMSPLSVAYFLNANDYHFDMVIFDEASQIFPQDAIGAIFRADQVIIAGDTKQLPPTSFFSTSTSNNDDFDDEEDDEKWVEENYDSILEETANVLPNRTLLWHYRSKHEHLISFSNQKIYRDELITFPSSNESEPDTGVEFEYVEDGYYEPGGKSCNILEARRCAELVKEHIDKHPERSLGIIAFSEKQQQAILREIQLFREQNPKYESFFTEGKEEEFFVKNLENVQGDERDTIIFSICYAKTKEQKASGKPMSLRFGPVGISGGERRLNVAITRAKINVKLVGSILPSDIPISNTESEGIHMLYDYIEFARNKGAVLGDSNQKRKTDDFANAIYSYITSKGYSAKQYIGCSDYKIDIAVEHPEIMDEYVAGIECDGFSYHNARTARDRDRLRSSVLKNMGWNMYRVWSTEWYRNPQIEGQKLIEFIEKAIAESNKRLESRRSTAEADKKKLLETEEKERKAKEQEEARRKQEEELIAAVERAKKENEAKKRKEEAEKRRALESQKMEENGRRNEDASKERKRASKQTYPGQMSINDMLGAKKTNGLLDELVSKGFECIDNRTSSNIIWVIYNAERKEEFEQLLTSHDTTYSREKRGSMATAGRDAWRIMAH